MPKLGPSGVFGAGESLFVSLDRLECLNNLLKAFHKLEPPAGVEPATY